jgi:polysaccharide pyruvyl transferase WcaK-like protein
VTAPTASARRLRVGFFGVLGSGNLGNDASLDVVVRYLKRVHPDADIAFFAMGTDTLARRYGAPTTPLQWFEAHESVPVIPRRVLQAVGRLLDPVRTWRWVREQDLVVVPGMGILETTTPIRPWGFPFGLLALAVAARLTATPLVLLCVGVEGGGSPAVASMFRRAAGLASYRSYRDEYSREAMHRLGVDVSADEVFPDLVFGHPLPPRHPEDRLVGVGVMNFRGRTEDRAHADEIHERYATRVAEVVRCLLAEGWRVRLLVGDVEDVPVAQRVRAQATDGLEGADPEVEVRTTSTVDQLLLALSGCVVVLGTRYHNILSSISLGIPTISVGYATKNDVLMDLVGLADFCQPARSLDVELTLDQFHDAVDRQAELSRTIAERLPRLRDGVERQLAALSTLIPASGPVGDDPLAPVHHGSAREKGAPS